MIIIPRERPVLENLNSYYLDISKLFEYCQGEFGYGCIHFKSSRAEGVVFFDKDDLIGSLYRDNREEITGPDATARIIGGASEDNFVINIYRIEPDRVYFWANISKAEDLYSGLSSEFTDLEGLIKKMATEKLTGCIEVKIGKGEENGLLFFNDGDEIGGSYSWGGGGLSSSPKDRPLLIQKSKESGGSFNVKKVSFTKREKEEEKEGKEKLLTAVLPMMEDLLSMLEQLIRADKKIKSGFQTILKEKFVEKTDRYYFLDPFAAEFTYSDQKITFIGDATDNELVKGVVESVREIVSELGLLESLKTEIAPWSKKYEEMITRFEIEF